MKQFMAFVRKEFYHILRDRRSMLILLGMPIMQIILFGFAISTEVKNVSIAVLDPSNDVATQHIIERFNASPYFTVKERLTNAGQINDIFQKGKINMILVFNEHFEDQLLHTGNGTVQLIADASDPNTATTLVSYANRIIASYQGELLAQYHIPIQIHPFVKMLYNPQLKSSYNFVPGVMGMILMLICAMMTAISIVREKEMGTMEVLLASPIKPLYIILAKGIPYFVLSLVNLTTIILLSVYVLDVPVSGSLFWLLMMSIIYILCSLALGILISTSVETQTQALLISGMALMMPVMLLSGMMFPIESMPFPLRLLSNIIPARWYIGAIKKIMIEGLPISFALPELIILGLSTIFLVIISLRSFKTRLE